MPNERRLSISFEIDLFIWCDDISENERGALQALVAPTSKDPSADNVDGMSIDVNPIPVDRTAMMLLFLFFICVPLCDEMTQVLLCVESLDT